MFYRGYVGFLNLALKTLRWWHCVTQRVAVASWKALCPHQRIHFASIVYLLQSPKSFFALCHFSLVGSCSSALASTMLQIGDLCDVWQCHTVALNIFITSFFIYFIYIFCKYMQIIPWWCCGLAKCVRGRVKGFLMRQFHRNSSTVWGENDKHTREKR